MYRRSYADIVSDDQARARESEFMALDMVVRRLEAARECPGDRQRLSDALDATESLWSVFLADVAHEHNALPHDTRLNIIAIGNRVFALSAELRREGRGNLDLLIDVNVMIRRGLDKAQ